MKYLSLLLAVCCFIFSCSSYENSKRQHDILLYQNGFSSGYLFLLQRWGKPELLLTGSQVDSVSKIKAIELIDDLNK